jgi:hypothetical protein
MDVGFETIGNATLICHDKRPVLVTDPWITGSAYFGSWALSHEIPPAQAEAVLGSQYVWLSHGHPDHLSHPTLELLRRRKLLIPDHVGGRIYEDLKREGFDCYILKDKTWTQLSPRIRVYSIADANQDAVLLIDIAGRLVANLNDAGDRGWGLAVKNVIRRYPESYLLALSGYGDADMINYFDEEGRRIPPYAALKVPVGQTLTRTVDAYQARFFVPFSSMHKYQRADAIWADEYTTRLEDYAHGYASKTCELLPPFVRRDFGKDTVEEISPRENPRAVKDPKEFGDDWAETLSKEELAECDRYFRSMEMVRRNVDFINLKVGGRDNRIDLGRAAGKGVTFELPRGSLMTSVRLEIFDDVLIGNYTKTTLHGDWGPMKLYPDFTPYVAKFADNGRARTRAQLRAYHREYFRRDPLGVLRAEFDARCVRPLQTAAADFLRRKVGANGKAFQLAKAAYWGVRRFI